MSALDARSRTFPQCDSCGKDCIAVYETHDGARWCMGCIREQLKQADIAVSIRKLHGEKP